MDYKKVSEAAERVVWLVRDLGYKPPELRSGLHDEQIVDQVALLADETGVSKNIVAFLGTSRGAPRLRDEQLGTQAEVERLEAALRYIGANCEDPESVRDHVSRALRGKSVP